MPHAGCSFGSLPPCLCGTPSSEDHRAICTTPKHLVRWHAARCTSVFLSPVQRILARALSLPVLRCYCLMQASPTPPQAAARRGCTAAAPPTSRPLPHPLGALARQHSAPRPQAAATQAAQHHQGCFLLPRLRPAAAVAAH